MSDPEQIERLLSMVLDPVWYRARYPDSLNGDISPLRHFIDHGLRERRDPNGWFDSAWYSRQYPDVAASGTHPLLHYLTEGAAQGRDPHPRFDAGWYTSQHPEAAGNPLLFHLRVGAARGWPAERPVVIAHYLPSDAPPPGEPISVAVDVIIPVYRGLDITRRCLESVLADSDRPAGRIIVVDDRSPEAPLRAYLAGLARSAAITLLRNKNNLGFVASVNRGMTRAGGHDAVLLNSDTEVPPGWLRRLQAQAYAEPKIASVSPLSNNATICSYLGFEGGPMPPGMTVASLDAACRAANAGRYVSAPTTVGFCMYIRRAALDEIGLFDQETFGLGYGEENDFCLRASALGWRHHIACDTFVRHEGGASFGALTGPRIATAFEILRRRYPTYEQLIAEYVQNAGTAPFRFAATMALFRDSGLPVTLVVSHDLNGGVRRHVRDVIGADTGREHYLVLAPAAHGVSLTVPALSGHPELELPAERWRDIAAVARTAGVSRVHVHHLMGIDLDVRALIHALNVPFDVTVHDYFAICPQVTLLPWPSGAYCGEPGPAGCDACIADRPSHGATDILSWRNRFAWLFHEAQRVLAPSRDALDRLARHGLHRAASFAPHEPVAPDHWIVRKPSVPDGPLRVAVLGTLASHKGAHVVASVAMAADPERLAIQLIGDTDGLFPSRARERIRISGSYQETGLAALLATYRPHVIWFPAPWPETYSYTLTAAIEARLPIAASEIGAFPERLSGRPLTWLIPPSLDPEDWIEVFDRVADALRVRAPRQATSARALGPDLRVPPPRPLRRETGIIDLRRNDVISVVVIPEPAGGLASRDGLFTPCANIRLLRPLDHPATGAGVETTIASHEAALRYRADVILTQRHAIPSLAAADALAAHTLLTGAVLCYDLDDDLLTVPQDHPEAAELTPKSTVVERMIRLAHEVRTSTAALAARVSPLNRRVRIMHNALDERIWGVPRAPRRMAPGPVRLVYMGTATHDADFASILPALTEIHRQFLGHVTIDLIGVVATIPVPDWIRRISPPSHAARSYAGFVHWFTSSGSPDGAWDIGLAPLTDTPFNACKSSIKALDYAALGLVTLASDVAAYRGSLADGAGGVLVPNTSAAWYEALSRLIRDQALRQRLGDAALRHFHETGTLQSQADVWRRSWRLQIGAKPNQLNV